MAAIAISFVAFALALVGILLGSVIQRMLPEGHLSSDSKEVVKLSMGVRCAAGFAKPISVYSIEALAKGADEAIDK